MDLKLKIWRQEDANAKGKMVDYPVSDVSPDMSFLEMLDVLNEELIAKEEETANIIKYNTLGLAHIKPGTNTQKKTFMMSLHFGLGRRENTSSSPSNGFEDPLARSLHVSIANVFLLHIHFCKHYHHYHL